MCHPLSFPLPSVLALHSPLLLLCPLSFFHSTEWKEKKEQWRQIGRQVCESNLMPEATASSGLIDGPDLVELPAFTMKSI